ncbi:MAG: LuxR C-terminal-related transcriptional regulator [Nitrospirota bacterium]
MLSNDGRVRIESVEPLNALTDVRSNLGVLLFTLSLRLMYMNDEARHLTRRLPHSPIATGLIPAIVLDLCDDLSRALRAGAQSGEWQAVQLRRVVDPLADPVLLTGFGLPNPAHSAPGWLLVLMELLPRPANPSPTTACPVLCLTDRERDVVEGLADGLTNKEIATRLQVSPGTVKAHLKRIMHKAGTSTRTGLLAKVWTSLTPLERISRGRIGPST